MRSIHLNYVALETHLRHQNLTKHEKKLNLGQTHPSEQVHEAGKLKEHKCEKASPCFDK